jgi:hypothetical protein
MPRVNAEDYSTMQAVSKKPGMHRDSLTPTLPSIPKSIIRKERKKKERKEYGSRDIAPRPPTTTERVGRKERKKKHHQAPSSFEREQQSTYSTVRAQAIGLLTSSSFHRSA